MIELLSISRGNYHDQLFPQTWMTTMVIYLVNKMWCVHQPLGKKRQSEAFPGIMLLLIYETIMSSSVCLALGHHLWKTPNYV